MLFPEIIRKKRENQSLTKEEIEYFVDGLADTSIPAEQISALAMAIYFNSMTPEETGILTMAMAQSGTRVDWDSVALDGPIVDKHSTGGIGDKVSFLLAPIVAACGGYVPMISGRGLGHTGGTLDKVDAIPNYQSAPDLDKLKKVVKSVGCAVIGQTDDIAPADRRFYAIRDVTSTVESIPLITASILSKKIAAGNQALVMDVKVGTGAFMQKLSDARALALSIIRAANTIDLKTTALITDMNQCLGTTAGNCVEIKECIDYLTNVYRDPRLDKVTQNLSAQMLVTTGLENHLDTALQKTESVISSGRAAEIFGEMVSALGGPTDFIENHETYLQKAPVIKPIFAETEGIIVAVNAREIGNAIIGLRGGRRRPGETLDLSTGFSDIAPIGSKIDTSKPIAFVHAANENAAEKAAQDLRAACTFAQNTPTKTPLIYETLTAKNLA